MSGRPVEKMESQAYRNIYGSYDDYGCKDDGSLIDGPVQGVTDAIEFADK